MRCGLFLTVCTPSGVSVESMMYVGMPSSLSSSMNPSRVSIGKRTGVGTPEVLVACERVPRRAVIALLGALATLPAEAHAATLTPDHACYLEGATASLTGTAFTPGASVGLALDGRPFGSAVAGPTGALTALGGIPELQRGNSARVKITATDKVNPANTATTSFRITSLGVAVDTSHGRKPDRRATFRARGFHVRSTLWLHYLTPGLRLYKTIKIGKLALPCGTASRTHPPDPEPQRPPRPLAPALRHAQEVLPQDPAAGAAGGAGQAEALRGRH